MPGRARAPGRAALWRLEPAWGLKEGKNTLPTADPVVVSWTPLTSQREQRTGQRGNMSSTTSQPVEHNSQAALPNLASALFHPSPHSSFLQTLQLFQRYNKFLKTTRKKQKDIALEQRCTPKARPVAANGLQP